MINITFGKPREKDAATISLVSKKEDAIVRMPHGAKIMEIGVDKRGEMTRRKLILAARKIITVAKANNAKSIAVSFEDFLFPHLNISPEDLAELLGTAFEMANFEFVAYKTPPPEGWKTVNHIFITDTTSGRVKASFRRGQIIGEEVNKCRALANTPGGEMTPAILAKEAKNAVGSMNVRVTILKKKEIEKLKMGGMLGVSRGSSEEPRFIIMEYKGGGRGEKPVVLVGKGVTFDTGGINLKPSDAVVDMHMDMSGGAAVIHTLALAAKLKLKKNLVGLIPAVENMPSGSSYHPGDVLRSMSGKTIEVLNTDAEGRIILADGITYAKKYNPELVVDIATLTGAAMAAVGQRCSAIFTKDKKWEVKLQELGEESGEYVWPLPLWDEYEEEIKGTFGDIINTAKTRYGGAITAAMFLYQFAKELPCPWVHVDMAPRMTTIEGEHLAKGAAGAPIRLLIKLLESI